MGLTVTGFTVLWSVLLILFIIAEAITVQLVSIWFAIGSLVALIANFCGANTLVQAALFVGVSFFIKMKKWIRLQSKSLKKRTKTVIGGETLSD